MTRTGWGALLAGLVLVALGIVLSWAPAAVVGVGALALVALALVFLLRPANIGVSRQISPKRVPKHEEALAMVHVTNAGRLPVGSQRAEQSVGSGVVHMVLPRLSAGAESERSYLLPTDRRGVFEIGPLTTTRQDPFGLVRRTRKFTGSDEFWVYPRILPFRPLPAGFSRPAEGPTSDMAPQGSLTFHRLRDYVVGDDLRLVHWKSTARTGQLMVRHMVDTSVPHSVVVVDLDPARYSENTFELALDAAASAVVSASRGTGTMQLRMTDGSRRGDEGTTEAQSLLDLLTAAAPHTSGSLSDELLGLRRERGGTSLVVVTGAVTAAELAAASRLRRSFYRVLVVAVVEPHLQAAVPTSSSGVSVVTATNDDDLVAGWNLESVR